MARGGALNLGGALISAIATLGLTIIVTQNFSPTVAGAFFVAMSAFLIVEAVANLGAYNGTIYFIARLRVLHAERRIPAIMRATIVPVVISSILAAIAVIIFAQPLASLLIDGRAAHTVNSAAVASALRALAGALPFAALTDTLLGAARGYHEMRPTVIIDRIGRSSLQTLGVLAAALTASSALLAPAWALPYVGASIAAIFWLRHIMRKHKSKPTAAAPNPRPATSPHPASSPDPRHRPDPRHHPSTALPDSPPFRTAPQPQSGRPPQTASPRTAAARSQRHRRTLPPPPGLGP